MKKSYDTEGRRALIEFLSHNPDRQFTVSDLCRAVNGGEGIGQSSIYRRLNELCNDEIVRKFYNESRNRALYQYVGSSCDCSRHFHEKCLRCGALHHLECDVSLRFAEHLLAEHGFSIDCGQTILYGVCAACRAAGEVAQ